jgi:hypothetical protein
MLLDHVVEHIVRTFVVCADVSVKVVLSSEHKTVAEQVARMMVVVVVVHTMIAERVARMMVVAEWVAERSVD